MGIEYNKNILQTVEEVRRRITDRVQSMTGLRIKELNATITDITFPEKEVRRRIGPRSETTEHDTSADETAIAPASPDSEPGASERDTMRVETRSQPESETTPETDAGAEDRPEESAEPRSGDARTEEQSTGETSGEAQTRAENETSEPPETKAEARRRRRAEERARRRTEDS